MLAVTSSAVIPKKWKSAGWLLGFIGALFIFWPAVDKQFYIGHEAEYIPYFYGEKSPGYGDTLSYTGMQVWWWLWGLILPADEKYIAAVCLFWSGLSVLWFASWIKNQTNIWIGLGSGLWLLTTPTFLAWSTSPYNVIFPFGFGCLFLCALQYA